MIVPNKRRQRQQCMSGFSPRSVGGCVLWLRSDLGSTVDDTDPAFDDDPVTAWTAEGGAVATLVSGTVYEIDEGTGSSTHGVYTDYTNSRLGQEHVYSCKVKYVDRQWVGLWCDNNTKAVWFDVQNGVVGTEAGSTGTIEALDDGWYQCTVTYTPATNANVRIRGASLDGNSVYTGTNATFLVDSPTIAIDDGVVTSWVEQIQAESLSNTTDIPTYNQTVAAANGKPEIAFSGINGNEKLVGTSLSKYKAMHGDTWTAYIVYRPVIDGTLFATNGASNTHHGIIVEHTNSDELRLRVGNGSGSWVSVVSTTTSPFPVGGVYLARVVFDKDATNKVEMYKNGTLVRSTTAITGLPSSSDHSQALSVGNRAANSIDYGGGLMELIGYDNVNAADDSTAIEEYLTERYDIS